MVIRSKAPLRIGLAGGGTDVSPFCDVFGGCVLNATINLYAYCTIIPTHDGKIKMECPDIQQEFECDSTKEIDLKGRNCLLLKGVYNAIIRKYKIEKPLSFKISTYTDAPIGSGLGTSSTLVVCILKAFDEWLDLRMGTYELAQFAFDIERKDLGFAGGRQDQYAAAFGGVNFIEFGANEKTVVNPLDVDQHIIDEIESSLVLFFVGVSRDSGKIIKEQSKAIESEKALAAMQEIKRQTFIMKERVLKGDFNGIAASLERNWIAKKQTASVIANPFIEEIHDFAMTHGAEACKISGAGGGGFMIIWCPLDKRKKLMQALGKYENGKSYTFSFTELGAESWKVMGLEEN